MQVGTAEARSRFRELLDRVQAGETVEITRRGEVLAVLAPPPPAGQHISFLEELGRWRESWRADEFDEANPFEGVRDPSPGREPW